LTRHLHECWPLEMGSTNYVYVCTFFLRCGHLESASCLMH
jgi:hypothetical protein